MDVKTVRELSRVMRDYDLTELEVEEGELKIRLAKGSQVITAAAPAPMVAPASAPAPAPAAASEGGDTDAEFAGCHQVVSPIPGTVYLRPNPDAKAYVGVGDAVAEGDVVCLVEAMKVFNEIKVEGAAGTVKKVCVEDGQPVEYGTVLFLVG